MTKFLGEEIELVASDTVSYTSTKLQGGGRIGTWYATDGATLSLKVQRHDSAGNKVGGEITLDPLYNFTVTTLADGGWLIWGWEDSATPASATVRRFDAEGERVEIDETADVTRFSAILGLADGGWLGISSVWSVDTEKHQLIQQRYDANGVAVGSSTVLGPSQYDVKCDDMTLLADGGWVVTWTTDYIGFQQHFNREGIATGPAVELTPARGVVEPTVTALADGGWLTVFRHGTELLAVRYDENGQKVGATIRVPSVERDGVWSWTVQGLDDGGWVVAWDQAAPNQGPHSVRALVFDALGKPMGHEYVVTNGPLPPTIDALDDGSFAITWVGNTGVSQRIYHPTDNNAAPVAVDDQLQMKEGGYVYIDPILNDYDTDSEDILLLESLEVVKGNAEIRDDFGRLYLTDRSYYMNPGETTTVIVEYTVSDGFDTDTGQLEIEVSGRASDGDEIKGTQKADRFNGSDFDEVFLGRGGNDFIDGKGGDDFLLGDGGRDILKAGDGRDTLVGGKGDDKLFGGSGSDLFIFSPGDGRDVITQPSEWSAGTRDILDFTSYGFKNVDQVKRLIEVEGHVVTIDLPGKDRIEIIDTLGHGMHFTI